MFTSVEGLLALVKEEGIETINCHFCDPPGVMQHFTIPAGSFGPGVFIESLSFDGSSTVGFQRIHKSDTASLSDPASAFVDPFCKPKILDINFFIHDPLTKEPYSHDPRSVVRKAGAYLTSAGITEIVFSAFEAELYVLDNICFDSIPNASYCHTDSEVGAWNSGRVQDGGNQGYKVKYKGGYFPVAPVDHLGDLRDDIVRHMENADLVVERAHHKYGTAGQAEISWWLDTMLKSAGGVMRFKYFVRNTAWEVGKTTIFTSEPTFGDSGSGMRVHSSLWSDGKPLFYDENGYAGPSDMARWYIGDILKHTPALLAFTSPNVSSFRRLVPGSEAPVNPVYSQRNRSICTRIPITGSSPRARRIESRYPDPSNNPYLAFAAILLAGLDDVQNHIESLAPIDRNFYELPPEEHVEVSTVLASLSAVLDALEADRELPLAGGVFTSDPIAI